MPWSITKSVQLAALLLTALALVPGGAHLFALPNKIGLARDPYFLVQGIYRGWALLGVVLIGALAANLVLTWMMRRERWPFVFAGLGALCIAATLVIFFAWTFPANQATSNWTVVPEHWDVLRAQWEYSHAVNALVTFAALCCVALSVLLTRD